MFTHNLKIAFRNIRKYKSQNIISIIGLAVGFVCFAFSALWIRYEMSYDSFHAKADRIYRVQFAKHKWETSDVKSFEVEQGTPYPLANFLKSNFPEIEEASVISHYMHNNFGLLQIDRAFCYIFDMPLPEFLFVKGYSQKPDALVNHFDNVPAQLMEHIVDQYNFLDHIPIPNWTHTNIPYNIIVPINQGSEERYRTDWFWSYRLFNTYILVKENVDIKALEQKLDKIDLPEWRTPVSLVLTPLRQLRYKDPSGTIQSEIKFAHIRIFAIAGLLVIICSLFNHLTLYVTRVRMRLRELALRKVNGATDRQNAATLYYDFLLIILLSLVAGFTLMAWLMPAFKDYAEIGAGNINIFVELSFYAILLILCGFFAGGIPVLYSRRQVLNESIKGAGSPGSQNLFRKSSLFVQLCISLGMIFCAAVFIKQMNYLLHRADLGIDRRNIATVRNYFYGNEERLKQVPGIIDVLPVTQMFLQSNMLAGSASIRYEKDGQPVVYPLDRIIADAHFYDFFGIEIIEGVGHSNEVNNKWVHNETAIKELGEVLSGNENNIGVVRDFYLSPVTKVKPLRIGYKTEPRHVPFLQVAYRFEDGHRQQTQDAIKQLILEDNPDDEAWIEFTYFEDIFEEQLKSEQALLKLLSIMTFACMLIAIFGVYSLTSLTCQQRRREIAIRKVHGAEILDIMNIFFKEYLVLLAMAALVAFTAGYLIMKRWLESYVKQTTMDAWLYVAIFLAVFAVIVFSIFSTVWRAANQNPAEVVKSE